MFMTQPNLFDLNLENSDYRPLPRRMRPHSLEEFYSNSKIRSEIQNILNLPRHVIFWGPPGTGKTTLAHILASELKLNFFQLNAVTGGIPELKKIISDINNLKNEFQKRSLLFIDEIHRFNKSQQDALLPYLENGDFILIGATTEFPYTSLNKAILSRVSLLELKSLNPEELEKILTKGIHTLEREDLLPFVSKIAEFSNGDARFALNQLSRLESYDPNDLTSLDEVIKKLFEQSRSYDKNASRHHDVISAFIKSIRGSDPDGALLYLAIMLDGGEDPEFIARRLMILASEDIGLANSAALGVATNAHYVTKNIGMPEARITLSHATLFLCLSPKSNSAYIAINEALEFVTNSPTIEVPGHISNTSIEKKNYLYPHDYPKNWVNQRYLPKNVNKNFYKPQLNGSELGLNELQAKKKAP
jgi:putative ATPase